MKLSKLAGGLVVIGVFLGLGLLVTSSMVTKAWEFPEMQAELTAREGKVELEREGELVWVEVTEPVEVFAGDSIRTGPDSEATINLYDQGVLHLAPESVMVLDASVWSEGDPEVFQGEVFLKSGNLWSRLFNFVSPESGFQVRTSSTVATVRGTTFWVGALPGDTSRVYVDNHVVQVRSISTGKELDVTEGEMARLLRSSGRASLRFAEAPVGADLAIIEKYRKWDKEYEADLTERQIAFVKETRPLDPESPLYKLQLLSERARLAVTLSDERQAELLARLTAGRILDAYRELVEHKNGARSERLLTAAKKFGGESLESPEVQRALLFFERAEKVAPEDLQRAQEADEEVEEVKATKDVVKTPPQLQPLVAGETSEETEPQEEPVVEPQTTPEEEPSQEPTRETYPEPVTDSQAEEPVTESTPTRDTTPNDPAPVVTEPVTYDPIIYQPVQPVVVDPIIYQPIRYVAPVTPPIR